jgi:hypothetical protein
MGDIGSKIAGGIATIITLAVIAIVISARANTSNVLLAFFGGMSNLIGVAISPVTGQSVSGLSATGVSTTGLLGGNWAVPVGATGSVLTGAGNVLGGINSLINTGSNLLGGSGSSGTGFVDTGLLDVGDSASAGDTSGTFDLSG